jgi:hypothetical protein
MSRWASAGTQKVVWLAIMGAHNLGYGISAVSTIIKTL